jgi:uncharacterized protein YjbI with pentapeptide repeats
MKQDVLQKVLKDHELWLQDEGGERADLCGANLSYANLSCANLCGANLGGADLGGADLSGADLCEANLCGADLSYANLSCANLCGADLCYANLCGANLRGANLRYANLRYANLRGADLRGADLNGVQYNINTAFFALQCPEEGAFVAWKKCKGGVLVKLLIPEDAKRSSATSRKCRASKAIVLEVIGAEKGVSKIDKSFVYEVGKEVVADSFDDDRWNECSHGIHFFITRNEAENY